MLPRRAQQTSSRDPGQTWRACHISIPPALCSIPQAAGSSLSTRAGQLPLGWGIWVFLPRQEEHLQRGAGTASYFPNQQELPAGEEVSVDTRLLAKCWCISVLDSLTFSSFPESVPFFPPFPLSFCFQAFPSLYLHVLRAAACQDTRAAAAPRGSGASTPSLRAQPSACLGERATGLRNWRASASVNGLVIP